MNITSVSRTYCPQLSSKKISFGKFKDTNAKNKTAETIMGKHNPQYSKDNETYFNICHKVIDYLDNTPYVNIQTAKGKNGQVIVYSTLNKELTDKHKNHEMFDSKLEYYKDSIEIFGENKAAQEAGLVSDNFLTEISCFNDAFELCELISDADAGRVDDTNSNDNSNDENSELTFRDKIDQGWYAF